MRSSENGCFDDFVWVLWGQFSQIFKPSVHANHRGDTPHQVCILSISAWAVSWFVDTAALSIGLLVGCITVAVRLAGNKAGIAGHHTVAIFIALAADYTGCKKNKKRSIFGASARIELQAKEHVFTESHKRSEHIHKCLDVLYSTRVLIREPGIYSSWTWPLKSPVRPTS